VDDYEVSYSYAKATDGRHSVRRSTMTTPSGNVITYSYAGNGNLHDWEANRVTQVKDGSVVLAHYDYNGGGHVVGIDLREADVFNAVYSGSTFPELDRHNRVIRDTWTKDLGTDVDFYDVDITYEDDGTISRTEDNIWDGRDVEYTHDGLKRLTAAEEGTWNGSVITSKARKQDWVALDQLGNWDEVTLDLNGDGDTLDSNEYDDDREHSIINELDQRNYDADYDTIVDTLNLSHDAAGNLIDDAEYYEYTYDAFNRLRLIELRGTSTVINEFRYNGLGHRILVDSSKADPVHLVYDERWRIVGRYVDTDTVPLEEFVYHAAGRDGRSGSSYIDHTILRDKDTDANGVLDERIYYVHNWRNDVVALVTDVGEQVESVRYSAYGIPFGSPAGDADNDGDVNASASTDDTDQIQTWISTSTYDIRGDLDLNGIVNIDDLTAALNNAGTITGWKDLTSDDIGNDKGYAGYEFDATIQRRWSTWHVRHRVLTSTLGRWMQRDALSISQLNQMYAYAPSPVRALDPNGQELISACITLGMIDGVGSALFETFNQGIQWYLGNGFDGQSVFCAGVAGVFEGCCTVLLVPALGWAGGCLCGVIATALENMCNAYGEDELDWTDPCLWYSFFATAGGGCLLGGIVEELGPDGIKLIPEPGEEGLPIGWVHTLFGFDMQFADGFCRNSRAALGTPRPVPGGLGIVALSQPISID
jgi:RHS repeat-associated protein